MRIVVAMSGGVDSSTVAGLMVEAGHDVIGLSMKTHRVSVPGNRACCTPDDMRDARQVALQLGIPFYVLDYSDVFQERIVDAFVDSYLKGETPNPCITCNEQVKFAPLLERARLLGADLLATGHYARIVQEQQTYVLQRGVDQDKDQSYFLYRLPQAALPSITFPLGEMNKAQVRDHARRFGFDVADKPESQEICFVGAGGYSRVVEQHRPEKIGSGPILNEAGQVVGQHQGIHQYTIGQRKGLGLATPTPQYVVHLDAEKQIVRIGSQKHLLTTRLALRDCIWWLGIPDPKQVVWVQLRHRDIPKPATVSQQANKTVTLEFSQPIRRAAPGQAAVVYREDGVVLGGGVVEHFTAQQLQATIHSSGQPLLEQEKVVCS